MARESRIGIARVTLVVLIVVVIIVASVGIYFAGTMGGTTTTSTKKNAAKIAELLEGKKNDLSWNQAVYEAMNQFASQMNASGKPVDLASIAESLSTPTEDTPALQTYGGLNYTMMIGAGATFQPSFSQVEGNYPKIGFIVVGGYSTAPNQAVILPRGDQGGFLMGAASALITQTGKVAIIGGLDVGGIALATKAFMLGVQYVNQNFNKNVTVINIFVGNFDDPAASQSAAATAVSEGAGVLFCSGDGITVGVATEAARDNVPFLYNEFNATSEAPTVTYGGISYTWTPTFVQAITDWLTNGKFTLGPYYYSSFSNQGIVMGMSPKMPASDATILNRLLTNVKNGNIQVYSELSNQTLVYSPLTPAYNTLSG